MRDDDGAGQFPLIGLVGKRNHYHFTRVFNVRTTFPVRILWTEFFYWFEPRSVNAAKLPGLLVFGLRLCCTLVHCRKKSLTQTIANSVSSGLIDFIRLLMNVKDIIHSCRKYCTCARWEFLLSPRNWCLGRAKGYGCRSGPSSIKIPSKAN